MKKFENTVIKGGVIFADSSMIKPEKHRSDISYFFKPLNDLIVKEGSKMLLNIVALGYFIKNRNFNKRKRYICS